MNNAGIAFPAPLAHQPVSDFRATVETNLFGNFIVTQVTLPLAVFRLGLKSPGTSWQLGHHKLCPGPVSPEQAGVTRAGSATRIASPAP